MLARSLARSGGFHNRRGQKGKNERKKEARCKQGSLTALSPSYGYANEDKSIERLASIATREREPKVMTVAAVAWPDKSCLT